MHIRRLCGALHVLEGDVLVPVRDVLGDGGVEQVWMLANDGDVVTKMMETEPIIGFQFFLSDFAIVATTSALVLNAIDVMLDVLDAHFVQLNLGNELKDDQMIDLMELVYENGLRFSLRQDVIKEFCQDD